jgi:transcriptional regulator with XRE-family HTH domain
VPSDAVPTGVASATLLVAMDIDWHIGDVITKLRKRRRMNQTVLAERVGVSKATIVRAEDGDGKVSRATYLKIAEVLKVDMATLEGEAARLQATSPDVNRQSGVPESSTTAAAHGGSLGKPGGHDRAPVPPVTDAQVNPVPDAKRKGGRLRAIAREAVAASQPDETVDRAARSGAPRQPTPMARPGASGHRVRGRKPSR